MSDPASSGPGPGTSDLTKPNCTIKPRQDRQLDELVEARYASRSEALRAAIESLTRSVNEDGETTIENLVAKVDTLSSQVDEIADRIDELEENLHCSPETPLSGEAKTKAGEIASAVSIDEPQTSLELENEVYTLLTERGSMSVPEIANRVSGNEIQVHESVSQLVDRGFVIRSEDEERPRYRVQTVEQ